MRAGRRPGRRGGPGPARARRRGAARGGRVGDAGGAAWQHERADDRGGRAGRRSHPRANDRRGGSGGERLMATEEKVPIEEVHVAERPLWLDEAPRGRFKRLWPGGPPHELFKRMRAECPVLWTPSISEFPKEAGFWSVTRAEDVHAVSRDWET